MPKKCFFCDLAQGEREITDLILETDEFFSMYDSAPASPGHALVIPKKHIVDFSELKNEPDKYIARFIRFIITTQEEIDKNYNPDADNIGINNGRAAGRTIDHLHVHLIPRYEGDVEDSRGGVRNLFPHIIPPESVPEGYS